MKKIRDFVVSAKRGVIQMYFAIGVSCVIITYVIIAAKVMLDKIKKELI